MSKNWIQLLFETCEAGVSSALAPELLPDNQNAWGMNIDVRGGKAATRPAIRNIGNIPSGLIQGCEFFGVQGGMLVASISGRLYRIRIGNRSIQIQDIPLTFDNSPIIKQVWMTQTVETLVIQDGQSNAIMYDGSTARRAVSGEVPRGRQMAYGNGRLWVAVNLNEMLAGDIRTGAPGSELLFTEATYLTGGGKLFFPKTITGAQFIPVTGQSDYGALLVYGAGETNAIRADITSRDDWGKIPGFVTSILRSVGAASQWSLVPVNQDLYWRDSNGGIRSIRNALADEAGPGSAPVSREVSRLTDYDSQQLLPWCSGVYFDNRLLMTSSPSLMPNGGVGWKDIISLDYAPLSSMGGKSQPAYNGQWTGLNFVKLVGGEFNGKNRSFALTTNDDGTNQLWEFGTPDRSDSYSICTDGTADPEENPITCFIEYPLRNFGQSKTRKRLDRCDVWLSSLNGEVDLKVYWRADESVKWRLWDEATTCAKTSDPSTTYPHVWKNLVAQERPQFKTYTIPDEVDETVKYSAAVGFEFQVRLEWTGRCRIHRMMLYAAPLSDPDYADRAGFEAACVSDDVTGNRIVYNVPTSGCPVVVLTQDGARVRPGRSFGLGGALVPKAFQFTFCNDGETDIVGFSVTLFTQCVEAFFLSDPPPDIVIAGQCVTFEITYNPEVPCDIKSALVTLAIGGGPFFNFTVDDEVHEEIPEIDEQPTDQTVAEGGETQFTVTVLPNPLPTVYQWQVSGNGGVDWFDVEDDAENYGGATTATLTITDAPSGFNDNVYRVRVRNEVGQVFSDEVVLTVTEPSACECALLIPALNDSGTYSNYAEASAAVSDLVADCLAFINDTLDTIVSKSADNSVLNKLDISASVSNASDSCQFESSASIGGKSGAVLTVGFNLSGTGTGDNQYTYVASLLRCGTLEVVQTINDSGAGPFTGSFAFDPLPDDGGYVLLFVIAGQTPSMGGTTLTGSLEITSSDTMVVNPVIALWDDSGTTRKLWACPKLLLPPLTESSGAKYSNCAAASTVLTDPKQVSNCVGHVSGGPTLFTTSFAAVDGGSSLSFGAVYSSPQGDTGTWWGCVNAEASATLIAAFSGVTEIFFRIYDDAGNEIDFVNTSSSPAISAALPYTGRYIIAIFLSGSGITTPGAVLTSSGVLSVNPIQALYNRGLDCSARLDCGDSCP